MYAQQCFETNFDAFKLFFLGHHVFAGHHPVHVRFHFWCWRCRCKTRLVCFRISVLTVDTFQNPDILTVPDFETSMLNSSEMSLGVSNGVSNKQSSNGGACSSTESPADSNLLKTSKKELKVRPSHQIGPKTYSNSVRTHPIGMQSLQEKVRYELQTERAWTNTLKREAIPLHKGRLLEDISIKNRSAAARGEACGKIQIRLRYLWQGIRNQKLFNDSPENARHNESVQVLNVRPHLQSQARTHRSRKSSSRPEAIRMQFVPPAIHYQIAVPVPLSDAFRYDQARASMRNLHEIFRNEIMSQNAHENSFRRQATCLWGKNGTWGVLTISVKWNQLFLLLFDFSFAGRGSWRALIWNCTKLVTRAKNSILAKPAASNSTDRMHWTITYDCTPANVRTSESPSPNALNAFFIEFFPIFQMQILPAIVCPKLADANSHASAYRWASVRLCQLSQIFRVADVVATPSTYPHPNSTERQRL